MGNLEIPVRHSGKLLAYVCEKLSVLRDIANKTHARWDRTVKMRMEQGKAPPPKAVSGRFWPEELMLCKCE